MNEDGWQKCQPPFLCPHKIQYEHFAADEQTRLLVESAIFSKISVLNRIFI